jgi:hypothetical protein
VRERDGKVNALAAALRPKKKPPPGIRTGAPGGPVRQGYSKAILLPR